MSANLPAIASHLPMVTPPRRDDYDAGRPGGGPSFGASYLDKTLAELFECCYRPLRLIGRSPKTVKQHEIAIVHFDRFLGRPAMLTDLHDLNVCGLMGFLHGEKKQSAVTVNKTVDKLLAEWRFYSHQHLVRTWPNVRKLIEPEIVPLAWTEAELEKLFAAIERQEGAVCRIPARAWWLVLHLILFDTAERIGAVLKLKWEHYDRDHRWLHIPAEFRKGRKRSRMVRLHEDTHAALMQIVEPERELILPLERGESILFHRYKKLLRAAGLPANRRCKFHKMRRTVATYFQKAGGDPQELLDHCDRRVTNKYIDPRIASPLQACDLLARPIRPAKGGAT